MPLFGRKKFNAAKLKSHLSMASQRVKLVNNKLSNKVKRDKREIAELIRSGKIEKARIKVEFVIREDERIEAHELIELLCETVLARLRLIVKQPECPFDLRSAVSTLIYAADRVEIPELQEIKKQLVIKYGKDFALRAEQNNGQVVNERIVLKLSIQPPDFYLVQDYMKLICKEYNVDWKPEKPATTEGVAPVPTGFSVRPGEATGFHQLYSSTGTPVGLGGTSVGTTGVDATLHQQQLLQQQLLLQQQMQQLQQLQAQQMMSGGIPSGVPVAQVSNKPFGMVPQIPAPPSNSGTTVASQFPTPPGTSQVTMDLPSVPGQGSGSISGFDLPSPPTSGQVAPEYSKTDLNAVDGFPTAPTGTLPTNSVSNNMPSSSLAMPPPFQPPSNTVTDVGDLDIPSPPSTGSAVGFDSGFSLPSPPSTDTTSNTDNNDDDEQPPNVPPPSAPGSGGGDIPGFDELTRRFNQLRH